MFNHDWFHGPAFQQQQDEARRRCVLRHFSDLEPGEAASHPQAQTFHHELVLRTLIYLRDGFSYEIRGIADVNSKSHLVFECEPVDDQYKVGAFVVTVPFEEIARVEVFAVHPSEKPEELPQITGFRHQGDPPEHKHGDGKPPKKSR